MLKKIVETIVSGAIGLAALYGVAKLAFSAGQEISEMEHRYYDLGGPKVKVESLPEDPSESETEESKEPEKVQTAKPRGKLGLLFGVKKLFGRNNSSIVKDLVSDPEDHKLEAYIDEGEVHINIKKRKQRGGTVIVQ